VTSFLTAAALLLQGLRLLIFGVAVAVLALAVLRTVVRSRRVSPFGALGRLSRRAAEPVFRPMESTLVRAGGQPGHAPWWTLAAVVVGGLALLSVSEFVLGQMAGASFAVAQGPRGIAVLLVTWTFQVLRLALMVRVLGSWFGQGRWSRWTRWAYGLTDWFMAPLARVVPPLGMLDLTPLVAYFGLGLLQGLVVRSIS
jgi:YggT family protein